MATTALALGIAPRTRPYPTKVPRRSNDGTRPSISEARQSAFDAYQAALRPNNTINTHADFKHQLTPPPGTIRGGGAVNAAHPPRSNIACFVLLHDAAFEPARQQTRLVERDAACSDNYRIDRAPLNLPLLAWRTLISVFGLAYL
jgi:hypothetical protein